MLYMGEIDTRIEIASSFHVTDWWQFSVSSPYNRLYWILAGEASVSHSNRTFHLRPGNLYLIPCFRLAQYHCESSMEHVFVHFTARLPTGIDLFSLDSTICELSADKVPQHALWFERLLQLNTRSSVSTMLETDGILRQLLSAFISQDSVVLNEIERAARFADVIEFINRNIAEHLALADLAAIANLHPTYFSNSFTALLGESPMRFLSRLRIERAQQLLWSTDLPVATIGNKVGYPDPAHFSRVFSKELGVSPSSYRSKREFSFLR